MNDSSIIVKCERLTHLSLCKTPGAEFSTIRYCVAPSVQDVGRSAALPVGSVKGNLGHADCANGHAAICKVICALETGLIPATLNHRDSNEEIGGLAAGRLRVVTATTPLELRPDSVVAVNTLGLACSVGHTVLQANPRAPEPRQDPRQHVPRLVTLSAMTEELAAEVAKGIRAAPFDTNYYRLVQDAFSPSIRGYNYRSYIICPPTKEDIRLPVGEQRSVCFVYSGIGSQWPGMATDLMRIPIFGETIERLHRFLEPKGVDLKNILTDEGPRAFDNILKCFLGITACQIALTNVLVALGLAPDCIVGHSVGELGCAYVDGCMTEEETILSSWARGQACNDSGLVRGMMAAIGLGHKDVISRVPANIDIACHNSPTSCTLSGLPADVTEFTNELIAEGVFAKAVSVSGIALHSRHIQPAAPLLRKYLQEVAPNPRPRSPKWIPTGVPPDERECDLAKTPSAEYQSNNLLYPVFFEEALPDIPSDAIVIELAPHGLLQPLLRRSLPGRVNAPLTLRNNTNPVRFLLNAIGK
ncbi:hypothetical protein ONE63_006688 [Megalurothrips usitatus]|uniref:Malonyl-CoA:ACP transacylase (MAT) domain-containing protein n=1 Tax=Megalurothrips usitatus TaxID=439358 RepID=A0AAV7XXM2_9NEOP|nr:hypothetical protein ONE63_006688 [Megalurothrips usitatus]